LVKDNQSDLLITVAIAFGSFWALAIITLCFMEKYMKWLVDRNPNSSARNYLNSINEYLGNTLFRNDYCKRNMNYYQVKLLAFFLGYMFYDVTLLLIFMNQFPAGILETLLHHLFSVYGATVGIVCGRFLGVLCAVTLLTEFSTPFVNIRWALYFHKKTDTTAYMINGWIMTVSFFLCRIVYNFYLIFYLCYPGWMELDWS